MAPFLFMEKDMLIKKWIGIVLLLLIFVLVVVLASFVSTNHNKATITLNKAEWKCTKTESINYQIPLVINYSITMEDLVTAKCIEYQYIK